MGRRVYVWTGYLFILALLAILPAEAQETRGSIEGIVKDSTGGGPRQGRPSKPGVRRSWAWRPRSVTKRAATGSPRCHPACIR